MSYSYICEGEDLAGDQAVISGGSMYLLDDTAGPRRDRLHKAVPRPFVSRHVHPDVFCFPTERSHLPLFEDVMQARLLRCPR